MRTAMRVPQINRDDFSEAIYSDRVINKVESESILGNEYNGKTITNGSSNSDLIYYLKHGIEGCEISFIILKGGNAISILPQRGCLILNLSKEYLYDGSDILRSNDVGSCITLIAINDFEWFVKSIHGNWG